MFVRYLNIGGDYTIEKLFEYDVDGVTCYRCPSCGKYIPVKEFGLEKLGDIRVCKEDGFSYERVKAWWGEM